MLGVSMKTYIRAVDTKKEREAQLIDRVHSANMSERKGVKKKKKRSELQEQMQSQQANTYEVMSEVILCTGVGCEGKDLDAT